MARLSLFSADLVGPCVEDLAGLLAAHGQLVTTAGAPRVSVVVELDWRAQGLAILLRECGVGVETGLSEEGRPLVRSSVSPGLDPLAAALSRPLLEPMVAAEGAEGTEVRKICAEPEPERRGRAAAAPPLRDLGTDPVSGPVVAPKEVRFGPFVTGGETNASPREGAVTGTREWRAPCYSRSRSYDAASPALLPRPTPCERPLPVRRTAAIIASIGLLVAGCGSSTTASPAASSSAPAASSSSSAASGSANLSLAAWSSAFCTAVVPLVALSKLPDPDTSTPAAAKASFVTIFTQVSVVLGQVVAGFDAVGPPPGGGSVGTAADSLNKSASTLTDLTASLSATDSADTAALSSVITKAGDELSTLKGTLATLDKSLSPEVQAGLNAAPECKALGG